jgi:hypothetical protein
VGVSKLERASEILSEKLFGPDDSALEMERKETFRRTSAEWAGTPEDLGNETSSGEVRCHTCYEPMRPVDAFVTRSGGIYCGACRKQMVDVANGE